MDFQKDSFGIFCAEFVAKSEKLSEIASIPVISDNYSLFATKSAQKFFPFCGGAVPSVFALDVAAGGGAAFGRAAEALRRLRGEFGFAGGGGAFSVLGVAVSAGRRNSSWAAFIQSEVATRRDRN